MNYMITYTGKKVFPMATAPGDLCIMDIAHQLAHQCRFNGATQTFYSVAQHSVHVSTILTDEHKTWGLLHDAAEAYLGDVIRPIKNRLPEYHALENNLLKTVSELYDLPWPMHGDVTLADETLLEWELAHFENRRPIPTALQPQEAKFLFLSQYRNLTGGHRCPCGCGMEEPEIPSALFTAKELGEEVA